MTEDEAKTKWCPWARVPLLMVHSLAANRDIPVNGNPHIPTAALCIASGCMAWRATDPEYAPQPPDDPNDPVAQPAGYCGLAGKP